MKKTLYLGIDPGKKGAWALLDGEGLCAELVGMQDLPYVKDRLDERRLLQDIIDAVRITGWEWSDTRLDEGPWELCWVAAIEHPLARSGESDWGHLMSGTNFGKLISVLSLGLKAEMDDVSTPAPHVWKQNMRLTDDKELSVRRAETLWPEVNLFRGPRGGKLDGRAEAALIAEWRRRRHLKLETDERGEAINRLGEALAGIATITHESAASFRKRHGW